MYNDSINYDKSTGKSLVVILRLFSNSAAKMIRMKLRYAIWSGSQNDLQNSKPVVFGLCVRLKVAAVC